MTRKIVFRYEVGYAGMEGIDFIEYPDDVTVEQLNEDAWQGAVQHAESYGYYPACYYEDEIPHMDEEEQESYVESIEGYWEDYDPEKHDGLVPGGGKPHWM